MTRRRAKPAPRPPTTRPPFPAAGVPLLGTVSDRVLARQLGVPVLAVVEERRARRIDPTPGGPRLLGERRTVCRSFWLTTDELAGLDEARGERPLQEVVREALAQWMARQAATPAAPGPGPDHFIT